MPMRWCSQAELRSHQIETGLDLTFSEVFVPLYISKVKSLLPSRVLEIGSGTGHLARILSSEVRELIAIEPSLGMFKEASRVLQDSGVQILNCTAEALPKDRSYCLAISHMVAHVVDDLESFFSSIRECLGHNGRLLFAIPHPCFFNEYKRLFSDDEYQYMREQRKEISFSITNDPCNKIEEVPYHHRPLSAYFASIRNSGLYVDEFEEVFPPIEIQKKYGSPWQHPRYCVFQCGVR